jgi:hypothetical protein
MADRGSLGQKVPTQIAPHTKLLSEKQLRMSLKNPFRNAPPPAGLASRLRIWLISHARQYHREYLNGSKQYSASVILRISTVLD